MNSKKLFLLASFLSLPLAATSQAALVYQHNFGGSGGDSLDDKVLDFPEDTDVAWTAHEGILADGNVDTSNTSAWLPYSFGSGIYEVTLELQFSTSTSGYGAISFTTAETFNTGALSTSDVQAYATFGIRGNRTFELWGGLGSGDNIDGGTLPDGVSGNGTLRLVLNTTGSAWTVDGYFTPSDSSEITVDLNGAADGTTYSFSAANQPDSSFTGVGIVQGTANVKFDNFTFSVVPEPSSLTLIGLAIAPLALRRARRGIA